MKLKFFLPILSIYTLICTTLPAQQVIEDDHHITTTRTWGEFAINNQRLLIRYFDSKLTKNLKKLGIPSFWNDTAKNTLLGCQNRFIAIVSETHTKAKSYAENQNVTFGDLLPTGFLMGLGVTGSESFIAGMGGSALLTLIVVPLEVEVYDKTTEKTTTTYEASWAIGGIGQGGVGAGAGGGIAVRGALGLIWGHLPDASLLQGTALGIGGSISAVSGLGFKAAVLFNTSDQGKNSPAQTTNLIALATYDMGTQVSVTVEAEVFYFLNQEQIMKFLSYTPLKVYSGIETVDAALLW